MSKYLNKHFAKKLLIVGAALYAVSYALNAITAYSILSKDCVDRVGTCTIHTEQIAGKIAMVIGYAGIGVFTCGLVALLVIFAKQKKQ